MKQNNDKPTLEKILDFTKVHENIIMILRIKVAYEFNKINCIPHFEIILKNIRT